MPKPLQFALGAGAFLLNCLLAFSTAAGGSGLNTVVVINQTSSNSCEVGNYFCERRQVPPGNVLFINWPGGNIAWTNTDFQTNLLNPLLAMLASRQLTNQIDYVVLSMDIPFQTLNGSDVNSTTSALFYGLKNSSGPGAAGATNSYFASEQVFSQAQPASSPGYSFLATMLTGNSVAEAEHLVDQGVAADGTFPTQPVILAKSSDPTRNIRFSEFDNAIFDTRLRGDYQVQRANSDSPWGQTNLLGYETGLASCSVSSNTFVPGAMADSLTSYGGVIFGPNNQTTLLAFTGAGAAGSYGTVTEPDANLAKFPNPEAYFYQARGFSLAECYYQSLFVPYEGLIVAEPLSAPCQRPALGQWLGPVSNAVLAGTAPLPLRFTANDAGHPLQQIDLFIDGKYFRTLTNLAPQPGNQLNVTLNGSMISYVVPTNSTTETVAAGLAAALNNPTNAGETMTMAAAYGDRVELQATAANPLAGSFYFSPGAVAGPASHYYRVVYLPGPIPPELTPLGRDFDGVFRMQLETPADVAGVVLASTNLVDWLPVFTNLPGGSLEFADLAATNYSRRFYRADALNPQPQLTLSVVGAAAGGGFALQVGSQTAVPYVIQASTNLSQWTSLFTNLPGGGMNFVDSQAAGLSRRFYRAVTLPPAAPPPQVAALIDPAHGGPVLQINGAAQAYVIQSSTDLVHWSVRLYQPRGRRNPNRGEQLHRHGRCAVHLSRRQPEHLPRFPGPGHAERHLEGIDANWHEPSTHRGKNQWRSRQPGRDQPVRLRHAGQPGLPIRQPGQRHARPGRRGRHHRGGFVHEPLAAGHVQPVCAKPRLRRRRHANPDDRIERPVCKPVRASGAEREPFRPAVAQPSLCHRRSRQYWPHLPAGYHAAA